MNKQLFEKICNGTYSAEELRAFNRKINEQEFDLDRPFEKYYNLENILREIQRYENWEITARRLACWANAYNWITTGRFTANAESPVIFQGWVQEEISCLLDGLSFFDDRKVADLDAFKTDFEHLDRIYKNVEDWQAFYEYPAEPWNWEAEDVTVLAVNCKEKIFMIRYYACLDYNNLGKGWVRLTREELDKRVDGLKRRKYQQIYKENW